MTLLHEAHKYKTRSESYEKKTACRCAGALPNSKQLRWGKTASSAADSTAEGRYTPGTYTETAVGMGGDVVVEMTFDANSITDVKVTGDQETPGIGTMAISVVLNSTAKSRTARLLLPRWRISIILPLAVW